MKLKLKVLCLFMILINLYCISAISGRDMISRGEPLPAWETEEEAALRAKYGFPMPDEISDPPPGNVESYAEWASADGVIIAWMAFDAFLADMVSEFINVGTCWIVVESASDQTYVESYLSGQGIPLDNVDFLIFNMDSVWMVDYGPFFVEVDGDRQIIDHIYDRYGRWEDDKFPWRLGEAWSVPWYSSDLRIEGGNFIADGDGICFITDRVIEQNAPYLSEQEVYDRLRDYCGCDTIHVLDRLNDGTGHIDMFAKLLDVDTMLIGQYQSSQPEYNTLENNATYVASQTASNGNPYDVVRVPMPGQSSSYWTYTNSLIVNDHVFVPTYSLPTMDAQAIQIYQTAMPGYSVVGIDASDVIGSGGAIHCTTKVVPVAAAYSASLTEVDIDDSGGDSDNILDPGETVDLIFTLRNSGQELLTNVSGYLTSNDPTYVTVQVSNTTWPDILPGSTSASIAPQCQIFVDPNTPENTELGFELEIVADSYTSIKTFSLTATSIARHYIWNLDINPGWTCEGDWAWGIPSGNSGDPSSGYTGSHVYGYNLSGNYPNNMPERSLTSEAIDCSNIEQLEISFMRWLGVESSAYDHAAFRISTDGVTWTDIWTHSGATVEETSWHSVSYDISSIADHAATVYLRWVMGSSDYTVNYCGWNIDDIEIWGVSTEPEPTATPQPITPTPTPTISPSTTPTGSAPSVTPTHTPPVASPTVAPSWTPSPTPTSPPATFTYTPSPTSTQEVPSSTATPTSTPIPITHTPAPNPTNTPVSDQPVITLILNKSLFHPGDDFILTCRVMNPGNQLTADEYILLDVYGMIWYWPSWSMYPDNETLNLNGNYDHTDTILSFIWPDTNGSADGFKFWAALVDPTSFTLLSNVSMVEFGYSDF
ncbi:agmatine deiminase family protein [bacterium]|nr:agmatine deiminase family protein [candidate division CSSED10-310 bacterium]